jgi:hypothetical protein
VEIGEERPPPPGSDFAQRVAYVVIALSLLVTIATVLLVMFLIVFIGLYG